MSSLTLINGDAIKLDIPSNSIDLIITHPPYFGVDVQRYGGDSSRQINASGVSKRRFLKLLNKATKEMYRVLKPNGQLWIANSPFDGISHEYVAHTLDKTQFNYVDCIYQHSYYDKDVIPNKQIENIANNSVTVWHHFAKGSSIYYNPVECRRHNDPVWSMDLSNGKDPVDQSLSSDYAVMDAVNKELATRLIKMYSKPGYTVLDPFGGTGVVPVTAVELGRNGILNDVSNKQLEGARARAALVLGADYDS